MRADMVRIKLKITLFYCWNEAKRLFTKFVCRINNILNNKRDITLNYFIIGYAQDVLKYKLKEPVNIIKRFIELLNIFIKNNYSKVIKTVEYIFIYNQTVNIFMSLLFLLCSFVYFIMKNSSWHSMHTKN